MRVNALRLKFRIAHVLDRTDGTVAEVIAFELFKQRPQEAPTTYEVNIALSGMDEDGLVEGEILTDGKTCIYKLTEKGRAFYASPLSISGVI